jgi:hypothetical protein
MSVLEDGKVAGQVAGKGWKGLSGSQLADLLKTANADLLANLGEIISEKLKGIRMGAGSGGMPVQADSEESLRDLAKMMTAHSEVDGTNFSGLGKETDIGAGNSKDGDKTIDLLQNID